MKRHLRTFWAATVSASLLITGCNPRQPHYFHEDGELAHYVGVASHIDYPDVNTCSLTEVENTRAPLTLDNAKFDQTWDITLEESVKITLENSKVMRTLGGRITLNSSQTLAARPNIPTIQDALLARPEVVPTVYDPAISQSGPLTGEEAALAAFDAQLSGAVNWSKVDRPQNTNFDQIFNRFNEQDLGTFTLGVTKTGATGTQYSIFNNTNYAWSNSPTREVPSDWYTDFTATVRQPLLQGAGVTFNRIAGPQNPFIGTGTATFDGVLLARINTDVSLADFEAGVRNLVSDVENAYWELYFAYRNLEARKVGRDASLATWQTTHAKFCVGARGGEAEKEAQARAQYHQFKAEVESALTDLFKAENRLRYIMGLSASDGRLIRPKDEPTSAQVVFDWGQIHAESLTRSVELRRQKWQIKRRELELIASKNLLLPRLDAIAQYRWLGLGDDLIAAERSGTAAGLAGTTAFESLTGGEHQEWTLGLQLSMPFGFRREMSTVRNQQLLLARERARLQDQELELSHELTDAVRDLNTQYQLMQTNFNRRVATEKQVEAVDAAYKAGAADVTFDVLLNAQRARSDAEAAYFRSLTDYSKSIANIHFRKGSLLEYNGVYLAEGPWVGKAYFDACKRARQRDASHYMNYGYTNPQVISRGPHTQIENQGIPVEQIGPPVEELAPPPADPLKSNGNVRPTPPIPMPEIPADPQARRPGARPQYNQRSAAGMYPDRGPVATYNNGPQRPAPYRSGPALNDYRQDSTGWYETTADNSTAATGRTAAVRAPLQR